jgi:folate-binding protein YgfZ
MSQTATPIIEPAAPAAQLAVAVQGAASFDLGDRTRIRVTGSDRLRWLNGMVTNAIQTLPKGHGNYNFILNAQGKIQGDAYIYRAADELLIDTDRSQSDRLRAHLDHFIIMDDVELHSLDEATTGIGLIGPGAANLLDRLGLNASELLQLQFRQATLEGAPVTLVHAYSVLVPRYELWFHPDHAARIQAALAATDAQPLDSATVEALRILQGIPRYGVDITDRHLVQETNQTRSLSFTKGCYLGQEIVERVRSRATVHRTLRQFSLEGAVPALPADLHAADGPAAGNLPPSGQPASGQLTSAAEIQLPNLHRRLGLGFVRTEVLERKARIEYDGGSATVLEHPPAVLAHSELL